MRQVPYFFSKEYHNLVNRSTLESKHPFLNEVVAKFALIAAEKGEERV